MQSENEYISQTGAHVVINGGNPLPGCPESWEQAFEIQKRLNGGEDIKDGKKDSKPYWRFDCGFKLDYDGPLITVSSRFYPPKNHYGPKWDGGVTIFLLKEEISQKEFEAPDIFELERQVREYVDGVVKKLKEVIKGIKF